MANPTTRYRRLGELMVERGYLDPSALDAALAALPNARTRIGEWLIDRGWASESQVTQCLAEQYAMQIVDPLDVAPDPAAMRLVEASFAREHLLLPLSVVDGRLVIAMGDPLDFPVSDLIERRWGLSVEIRLATPTRLLAAIDRWYNEAAAAVSGAGARRARLRQPRQTPPPPTAKKPRLRRPRL
jgi:type IV pilus assembly protein PilB